MKNVRRGVVAVHRWVSLIALAFWIVQALTGIFAVFHWEIDDAVVAGAHRPTDFRAIEERIAGLEVGSIWTSASGRDRYDVNLSDRVLRIDGAGNALRERMDGERWKNGGFVDTFVTVHHELLSGETGRTIVGLSGCILFTNILLGLYVARPWKKALRPTRGPYSWHRAIGTWVALPMLFLVAAGVLMAFEETTEEALGAGVEAPKIASSAPRTVGLARAVEIARARLPGAEVSGINFPGENPVWRVTLKQHGERRRAYGRSRVWVSAIDGSIAGVYDVFHVSPGAKVYHYLFAFHTGEVGGFAGRIVVLLVGCSLLALIYLGIDLWMLRRKR